MGLGRRGTPIADDDAWVFNRMADVYDARPAYPQALITDIATHLAVGAGRVLDVGAGTGHLTLPLALRGLQVTAIDPARAMLERLQARARAHGCQPLVRHAAAEDMPFDDGCFDGVVIADALHFLDVEQTGAELARVLRPGAGLVVLQSELGDTPFMRAVLSAMEAAAPRRPRRVQSTLVQLASLVGAALEPERTFEDHTPVDAPTLAAILRSISFIGPAMNEARWNAFWSAVSAVSAAPVWSRKLTLTVGRRAARGRSAGG